MRSLLQCWPTCRVMVFSIVALVLLIAGCGEQDGSWQRVTESGVLRVGLDPTYPPFELATEDSVVGLDVDLIRLLSAELGVEPEFVYFGYDGLYDALLTGQVDVLASALVIDPDRTRDFAYSMPYYDAGQILLVPHMGSTIDSLDDLEGQTVAVELGTLGHVEALAAARQVPDVEIVTKPSAAEALEAVAGGRADAALVDSITGRQWLLQHPADTTGRLRRVGPPVSSEPYALVVRSESKALLDEIDRALSVLMTDGEIDRLVQQWIGP